MGERKKVAWVTGSSRGIGRAIAERFLSEGYRVVVHANKSEEVARDYFKEALTQTCTAMLVVGDISLEAEAKRMYDEIKLCFGQVDVLVNNAGVAWTGLFTDMVSEDWNLLIDTNLKGTIHVSQNVVRDMVREKSGRIINISSMWGRTGASCEVVYSMVKAGIIGFTKALAKEVGISGILVNCVAPGVIDTDMLAQYTMEEKQVLAEESQLGRLGTPEEVASTVYFLASEGASFVTGEVISPCGGYYI